MELRNDLCDGAVVIDIVFGNDRVLLEVDCELSCISQRFPCSSGRGTEQAKTGQVNPDHLSGHFYGHFRGHLRGMFHGSFRGG